MSFEEKNFFILLVMNQLMVFIYCVCNFFVDRKQKKISIWSKAAVMTVCPVIGPFLIFLSFFFYKTFFSKEVDLADVIFNKDRVKTYLYADEERGRNVVSIEEALAITDKEKLRVLMMNVIRGNIQKSLYSISLALNSEDSETSHYAASVLQEALNEFRNNVQKCYKEIKKGEEDQVDYALILIDYMNRVLSQGVFTDIEQKAFVEKMDEVAEILYKRDYTRMGSKEYEAVSLRLLDIKDYEKCEKWCDRSMVRYPKELSSFTCCLKLYFSMGNRKKFFEKLEELRFSNIIIDKETLEMMRVFNGSIQDDDGNTRK